MRGGPFVALLAALSLAAAGCGGERQDANEEEGDYSLEIVSAEFPAEQRIAEATKMRIEVRNADDEVVPHVAVTVKTAPGVDGESAEAFSQRVDDSRLADPSRPVWIVDEAPSSGQVAYANTWAYDSVRPGDTVEFEWTVTAVKPGDYTVDYEVFPGLDGKAKLAEDSGRTSGSFDVTIEDEPPSARVGDGGQVIREEPESSN